MGTGVSKGGGGGNSGAKATAMTDDEAYALKDQYESGFSADTKKSVTKYISAEAFDGKGHSLSQTMNYLISQGEDLETLTAAEANSKYGLSLTNANMAAMRKTNANIDAAMHPLGKDTLLQRGAHSGMIKSTFGISNYQKMTNEQLAEALVGQTFQNTTVLSTSYNVSKNPFLSPSSPVSGGREVIYNIKAGAKTPAVFGAMNQAEVVLGKGINFRVTGARFTGKTAHPKGGKAMKQIEIDIETY